MNASYERLHRSVKHILTDAQPNDPDTVAHALMALIIAMDAGEIHRAGKPEPRIKEGFAAKTLNRTDGWRAR